MPFVPVPKDLNKVKTKVIFNLTKRQLICFSGAVLVGLPTYLLGRLSLGNDIALFLMIGLMTPFFFLAMYEKDGQPAEKVARNILRSRFLYPLIRPYKTENLYMALERQIRLEKEAARLAAKAKGKAKRTAKRAVPAKG